ncbi:MAG TPA: hypothetical protein VE548_00970 [Nitrososphaeraceae archaeon]|nr:hypothetical protein [Nitrososphaeraceae archaeon]
MMMILRNPIQRPLSYNARKALLKGVIVGAITAAVYLTVVVVTTPNLPPSVAINAALTVNGIIIVGLAVGVGIQIFASSYSKGLGCRIGHRQKYRPKKGIKKFLYIGRSASSGGSSGGSTAISSFLSFFSLVPLGCCGSWLFILSALPAVFGGTLSVVLIEYSTLLSYVGLTVVVGFAALSVLRLRKELNERRMLSMKSTKISDGNNNDGNTKASLPNNVQRGLSS